MDTDQSLAPVADSLALALVASSDAPILLLDGDATVIAASASFARAFQIDPGDAPGQSLFALGEGEWEVPQLRSLLRATLSGALQVDAYEMDLKRSGRLGSDLLELGADTAVLDERGRDLGEQRRFACSPPRARRQLADHHGCDDEHEQREPVPRVRERERVQRRQEEEVEREHRRDRHRDRKLRGRLPCPSPILSRSKCCRPTLPTRPSSAASF